MTNVGDIISPGATAIPDDVLVGRDREGDVWVRNALNHWHIRPVADPATCDATPDSDCGAGEQSILGAWLPFTVMAVRDPQPDPTQPHDYVPEQRVHDGPRACAICGLRRAAGVHRAQPPLLDLVRQHGSQRYMHGLDMGAGLPDAQGHKAAADALFDRIATLAPALPVQARDAQGNPLWLSATSAVVHHGEQPDLSGSWHPLLVGGDPAPAGNRAPGAKCPGCGEASHRGLSCIDAGTRRPLVPEQPRPMAEVPDEELRDELQACSVALRSARDLIAQVMAELSVDRPEDVLSVIRRRADGVNDLTKMVNRFQVERDKARAARDRYGRLLDEIAVALGFPADGSADLLAEVERLKAVQPDGPIVLRLPEVDPRTVALVSISTGARWVRSGLVWRHEQGGASTYVRNLAEILWIEHLGQGGLRVEMAPPAAPRTAPKPRTWPARPLVDDAPDDLRAVRVPGGEVYRRDPNSPDRWISARGVAEHWELLREVDLEEVTEPKDRPRTAAEIWRAIGEDGRDRVAHGIDGQPELAAALDREAGL